MRVSLASIAMLFVTATAYAQTPCASAVLTYDPYKPSDLAIVRNYGSTVLAQAPVSALLKLDPYVPSQGELLRQMGGGIPVWTANPWYGYGPRPAMPDCVPESEQVAAVAPSPSAPPLTRFGDVLIALQRQGAPTGTVAVPPAGGVRPEKNTGVWIQYGDRTWVSAGGAVPFSGTDFVRVGESAGLPVYRRTAAKDELIFIPTSRGMVAPFRPAR